MGGKKKMSKKEKARLEAEQAELQRVEMEKERQRRIEEEKAKKEYEKREAEKRRRQEIIENRFRKVQLKETAEQYQNFLDQLQAIQKELHETKDWETFLRNIGLPNSHVPGDLRKYLHIWSVTKSNEYNAEYNWLLKTNERTVLTQDRSIPNLTRAKLKTEQSNLGDSYSARVTEVLKILSEVDEAIDERTDLSALLVKDLQQLKQLYRLCTSECIDDFTHRILSNIKRDMDTDGKVARLSYVSPIFKLQIWANLETDRPVNSIKERREGNDVHTEIEFSVTDTSIILPSRMKYGGCAIRVIWFGYDHCSDTSASFYIPIHKEILSLRQSAKVESVQRKKILAEALQKACDEIDEQGLDDFLKPEPYEINVDKLYAEYEDNLNKIILNATGPTALNLEDCDINLRCQRIVGGVFLIDFIEQPQQDVKLDTQMFLRTISVPNSIKHKEFYQTYKAPPAVPVGVRRLPEEIEAEIKMVEMNLDKLIQITIQLTDNIFWFEPPIVCRWESSTNEQPSDKKMKKCDRKTPVILRKDDENGLSNKTTPCKNIDDFNIFEMPSGLDMACLIRDFVLKRIPNGFCIKIESLDQAKRNSILKYLDKKPNRDAATSKRLSNVRDFLQPVDIPHSLIPTTVIKQQLNVNKQQQNLTEDGAIAKKPNCYMFSQLIEDLDDLCDELIPYPEQHIEDIISVLSNSESESLVEEPVEVEFFGFSILRDNNEAKLKAEADAAIALALKQEQEEEDEWSDDSTNGVLQTNTNQSPLETYSGKWTTRDIHDLKFNEEKLSIQFRAGRFGMFAFAVNRYCNLPFQSWEIRPDLRNPGTVTFTLTAAVISIDATISIDGVRLNSFQGGISNIVQSIVGTTMKLEEFKRTLKSAAIELFPDNDAFCYSDGTCEKHFPMESHLYECMSMLAMTHSFSWSRWNLLAGSRTAILLTREIIEHRKLPPHSTLHVTPLKSSVVESTEISPSFNPKPVHTEYYADVYHLGLAFSQPVSLVKQQNMHPVLRNNIIKMLKEIRPLSFS